MPVQNATAAQHIDSVLPILDSRNLHLADTDALRSEFYFFVKTVQSTVFRTLVDAMKEIVADTNIVFSPQGIVVKAVDQPQNAMIHLQLRADRFEEYVCDGTHVCGIALIHLHRLLKTMSSTDVLMFYMRRNAEGIIDIRVENNKKAKTSHYELFLLDLPKSPISTLKTDPHSAVVVESGEFHKIVREMRDISSNIDIRIHDQTLTFKSVKGAFADASVFLGIERNDDRDDGPSNEVVQGVFSLRYLSMFTKCTPLSKHAVIYLRNDFPLVVKYDVSNMGTIELVLMMEDQND